MPTQLLRGVQYVLCLAILACCAIFFRNPTSATVIEGDTLFVLAEENGLRWYRGNLHTHTHWSDGDHYLEAVAQWYKDHDYDFLSITDHNTTDEVERWVDVEKSRGGLAAFEKLQAQFPANWNVERIVENRREIRLKKFSEVAAVMNVPEKFLLVPGEEISDKYGNRPIHLNATNIRDAIPPLGGENVYDTLQRNVDALLAQRDRTGQPMIIHLNHPNFGWGITAEDLMRVRGENFFEVYNGHPGVFNSGDKLHASTEQIWDIINAFRLTEVQLPLMYGLATDDGHSYHKIPSRDSEPGRAWVMVLCDALTPDAIIAALETGQFYASNGVALERIELQEHRLIVQVLPTENVDYTIEFIGTNQNFSRESSPVLDPNGKPMEVTRKYSPDIGRVLKTVQGTSADYAFTGEELYVRARITSSRLHPNPSTPGDKESAWTQPVLGPAAAANQ